MVELSAEQESRVRTYLERFENRFRRELSDKGWMRERREREQLLQGLLGKDRVLELTEAEFRHVLGSLWANLMWGKKEYPADRVLESATLERVREELYLLLWGDGPIPQRYDGFRKVVRGMGPSMITEILCFVRPKDYCVWNEKPKNVLPLLGMKTLLPDKVYKYPISGNEYARIIEVLDMLRREIDSQGFAGMDFMDLDIFIWLLFTEVVRAEAIVEPKSAVRVISPKKESMKETLDPNKLDHWDAMAILLDLGNILGYDTYTSDPSRTPKVLGRPLGDIARLVTIPAFTLERHLDTVKNVDVIWFKEEFPSYCFEVEYTTGVTLGLLRLYQIRKFTQAGFFIIAPANILSRFKSETEKDPFYTVKDRYNFRSFDELVEFYEEAKQYHLLRDTFLGREMT